MNDSNAKPRTGGGRARWRCSFGFVALVVGIGAATIGVLDVHRSTEKISRIRERIGRAYEPARADIDVFERWAVMSTIAMEQYAESGDGMLLERSELTAGHAHGALSRFIPRADACTCIEPIMLDELLLATRAWLQAHGHVRTTREVAILESRLLDLLRTTNSVRLNIQFAQAAMRREATALGKQAGHAQMFGIATLALTLIAAFLVGDRMHRLHLAARAGHLRAIEAAEDKVRFARGVTHDIRNPLGAAMLLIQTMRKYGQLPPAQINNLKLAEQGVRDTLFRIEAMLDLTCAEARTLRIDPKPAAMQELLHDVADMHAPIAAEAGLVLRDEPSDCHCLEMVDRKRCQQILDHLVGNAIKYTERGGTITLGARRGDGRLHLYVTDTGRGMSETEIALIFDEFYHRTEHAEIQGSGLGLAISRKLAQLMGGTLTVTSRAGEGSTFTLSLPAAPCRARACSRETRQESRAA